MMKSTTMADQRSGRPATVLRPYQADHVALTLEKIAAGDQRILQVAPTGSGKTVVASEIMLVSIITWMQA